MFRTKVFGCVFILCLFSLNSWGQGIPPPDRPDVPDRISPKHQPQKMDRSDTKRSHSCKTVAYKGDITFNSFTPTGKSPLCTFNIDTYWGDYNGYYAEHEGGNSAFLINACRAAEKSYSNKQEVWMEGDVKTCKYTWGTTKTFEANFILLEKEGLLPASKLKEAFPGKEKMGDLLEAPGQVVLYKTYNQEKYSCSAILRAPTSAFSPEEADETYFEVRVYSKEGDKIDLASVFNSQAVADCTTLKNAFSSDELLNIKGKYQGWAFIPVLKLISIIED